MKVNTQFNLKPLLSKLRSNLTIVFWVMLIILLLVEAMVLKKIYDKTASARTEVEIKVSRQVRINDAAYNDAVKRIEDSKTYDPKLISDDSPFGVVDTTPK